MQIAVTVTDANNIICEVTPPTTQLITIDRGVAGPSASIAVGTTTTLPPGSAATVTNVGNSSAAIFNFAIPEGAPGTGSGSVTSVDVSGGTTGLTTTGGPVTTSGTITLGGTLGISNGGTSATTALGARTALLPSFSGNAGKVAAVNSTATDIEYIAISGTGTVTSVDVSGGTTGLTASGGPITSSGTITLAGTLAVANGGTGITSFGSGVATFLGTPSSANLAATVTDETGTGFLVFSNSPTLVTPALGTPSSATLTNATNLPIDAGTIGTLPVNRGGTGSTSLTANNVILGNGTSAVQVVAPSTAGNVLTSNGTTWSSAAPAVTLSGTETLSNKTLTAPIVNGAVLNDGYTEEVYAVIDAAGVALSPSNGSIQTWVLGASRTPTSGTWNSGQSMTLMIDDGASYAITWTTLGVVWVGGSAPTLATSGYTVVVLWKVGTTIYGSLTGQVA